MANVQNLRPGEYKLTHEEQKKGGKASVAARRRKKNLHEAMAMVLSDGVLQPKTKAALEKMGVDAEEMSYNFALAVSMLDKALKGDVQAAKLVAEWGMSNARQTNEQETDPLSAAFENISL